MSDDFSSELSGLGQSAFVIDTDGVRLKQTAGVLLNAKFKVETASDSETALSVLDDAGFDLVLYENSNSQDDPARFVRKLREIGCQAAIIVLSTELAAEKILDIVRFGASDVILRPFSEAELLFSALKTLEREHTGHAQDRRKAQTSRRYSFANIVAQSPSMLEIFDTIKKIADYKTTVMLYGESGTGKELVAKAIHYNSVRRGRRFIAINCGAIPENLLESELFGHKKGAFTDALRDKKGLFEEAEGGTILLDEIGELPLHLQVKLLRVIQENEIRPVGDSRIIPIDVRLIAATLRDLENDVLDGRFRDDLFYRLNVVTIRVPPLRERKEDIPLLVNHFIKKHQEKLGLSVYGIAKDALSKLLDHDWPGNIRELENCIERAMILTEGSEITVQSLPKTVKATANAGSTTYLPPDNNDLSIKTHSRALEESLIQRALEKTNGNRTHAAKLLEISHRTLLYKLKEYNLVGQEEEAENEAVQSTSEPS